MPAPLRLCETASVKQGRGNILREVGKQLAAEGATRGKRKNELEF